MKLLALAQWMVVLKAVSKGLGTASDLVSEQAALQAAKVRLSRPVLPGNLV